MPIRTIPTSTILSDYTKTLTLGGREYLFRFTWNQRAEKWFLSIFDQDELPIAVGIKVVVGAPLNHLITDERGPKGILYVFDTEAVSDRTTIGVDPGLTNLGERHVLIYIDEDSVNETLQT